MPLPVAHGLLGAAVAAALSPSSRPLSPQSRSLSWKTLLAGALLGICPDFDYALNWLRISGGGWHHGFTHSIFFALVLGLLLAAVFGHRELRYFALFSCAIVSHTLLDLMLTESRGVALWWPFSNHRYKLRFPNPIDYSWSQTSLWQAMIDVIKISLAELIIFAPILLLVILVKRSLVERTATS